MFSLTNPIALFGLLAIGLPLAIHLLQRGSGPVVKVGSLSIYRSVAKHRFWKLEPRHKLLLLFRAASLVLLVLFLAGFHWHSGPAAGTGHNWVLVSPAVANAFTQADLPESQQMARNTMQGLLAMGYQERLLAPGFPKVDPQRPMAMGTWNYWSLAGEAATSNQGPRTIHVFAEPFVGNYRGSRPQLDLSWTTVPLKTTNRWVAHIQNQGQGELRVILGQSDAESTQFKTYLWSANRARQDTASFPFEVTGNRLNLKQTDGYPGDDSAIIPDPTPLKVGLFTSEARREDARFLKAALQAMIAVGTPLDIVEYGEKMPNPPPLQWVFWLSREPLPEALIQQIRTGAFALADAKDQPDLVTTPLLWGLDSNHPFPEIRKRVEPGTSGRGLWFAGDGKPILTMEMVGSGRHYQFHSRFHPSWTNLVFSEAFPRAIHQLLSANNPGPVTPMETRELDEGQIAPIALDGSSSHSPETEKPPPSPWLWATALLCFLTERWLSDRNRL